MTTTPPDPATMADDLDRLSALYASGLLEDGPQQSIDALVALAAALLECPVAMLNLVDHDVQHIRASVGTTLTSTPRAIALCDHTIREPEGMVVPDLAADPRFADNPLIELGIRFYAGAPVSAPDAGGTPRPIGALCVTDAVPRQLDERGRQALGQLARLADSLIAARADARHAVGIAAEHQRLVAELARQHLLFAQAERLTGLGAWRVSLLDERLEWSEGVFRIYGLPVDTVPDLRLGLAPYPPEARARVAATLARAIEQGEGFDIEEDFRNMRGEMRRIRCIGEAERVDGTTVALLGVFQDVTDRYRMESALRRDAATDALTGLANRAAFDRALDAAIDHAHAASAPLILALIDLDGFKLVNDTLGHPAGDEVLRKTGAALSALPVAATTIARIGGDEFALLVEGDDEAALAEMVERGLVLSAVGRGLTLACSGSVGTASLEPDETARDFVHRADLALYAAKRARIGERRRRRAA